MQALGLDGIATVWSRDAASALRGAGTRSAWDDFDLGTAQTFAKLTSVAYCSNTSVIQAWNCTRCRRVPSFKVHKVVFDAKWDLLAYVGHLPELNAIVPVFRGTDNSKWGNWIENLRSWHHQRMWPVPEAPHAKVHAGFFDLWTKSSMQLEIMAAIAELLADHPDASLYVTGHSMGAALANLCALDAKFKHGLKHVHSFTFGSPRVGDSSFYQVFDEQLETSWRFTHNRDVVPSLPPSLLGYHHVAREIWTVDVAPLVPGGDVEQEVLMCDSTGEDASCHNSACLLGLCTSVADHLMYLEYEMYHRETEC